MQAACSEVGYGISNEGLRSEEDREIPWSYRILQSTPEPNETKERMESRLVGEGGTAVPRWWEMV